jgi:hypothetical protein
MRIARSLLASGVLGASLVLSPVAGAEPLEERKATEESEAPPVPAQTIGRCEVTVFVEPDPEWRQRFHGTMTAGGDTVYAAANAAEAIELFRTQRADCYLISGMSSEASEIQAIVKALRQATPEALITHLGGQMR